MANQTRNAAPATLAVGYVRVSTEEQAAHGVSLDAQRAKIADYCRLHGMGLTQTFCDEGLSGRRADNRPGLQQAIDAVCYLHVPGAGAGPWALVVYSLSRLARSTRDAIEIAERISRCGADLVSISEKIDTTTGMGRFFFTTVAALAQLERDQISERTAMALAHKRTQGKRISHRIPMGYDLAPDGVHLHANEAEREVVHTITRLHAVGWSSRKIIHELERQGLKPKCGGRWHPKVVLEIAARSCDR